MALSPSALAFRRDYTKQHEPEMKAVCLYIYTPLLSQDLYLDTYIYTGVIYVISHFLSFFTILSHYVILRYFYVTKRLTTPQLINTQQIKFVSRIAAYVFLENISNSKFFNSSFNYNHMIIIYLFTLLFLLLPVCVN